MDKGSDEQTLHLAWGEEAGSRKQAKEVPPCCHRPHRHAHTHTHIHPPPRSPCFSLAHSHRCSRVFPLPRHPHYKSIAGVLLVAMEIYSSTIKEIFFFFPFLLNEKRRLRSLCWGLVWASALGMKSSNECGLFCCDGKYGGNKPR